MKQKLTRLSAFCKTRRAELGISKREDLAKRCDLKVTTIASIESGLSTQPRLETLHKLAKGLEVEVGELARMLGVSNSSNKIDSETLDPTQEYLEYLVNQKCVPYQVASSLKIMLTALIQEHSQKTQQPSRARSKAKT